MYYYYIAQQHHLKMNNMNMGINLNNMHNNNNGIYSGIFLLFYLIFRQKLTLFTIPSFKWTVTK
jgi:hypothetical protein